MKKLSLQVLNKFSQKQQIINKYSGRHFSSQLFCLRDATTTSINYPKFEHLLFDKKESGVGLITLNRPKALNALCKGLAKELKELVQLVEVDPTVRVLVLTGMPKAFAAGADIKEMSQMTCMQVYQEKLFNDLDAVAKSRKPIIAAVDGYALGGGCELAMLCDIIIAGTNAKFGQPEITLGVVPGIGGTQRLTRAIGKAKAMEWMLTGALYSAEEAEKAGLVSRVVPSEKLMEESMKMAEKIATYSLPATQLAKECVNKAFETTLEEGINLERRIFSMCFSSKDQKEGMGAFIEKRKPNFVDE
ncbi:hypothetical protein ABK040_006596 [Willaertia magna]